MMKLKREDVKELDQKKKIVYLKDGSTLGDVHYLIKTKEHVYIYDKTEHNKFRIKHDELAALDEVEDVLEKIGVAILESKITF